MSWHRIREGTIVAYFTPREWEVIRDAVRGALDDENDSPFETKASRDLAQELEALLAKLEDVR